MTEINRKMSDDMSSEKSKVQRDVEVAESRAAHLLDVRKKAPPNMTLGRILNNPMEAMQRRLVPESFARKDHDKRNNPMYMPGAECQVIWDLERNHSKNINRGCVPVLEEDGTHARHNEVLMYKRPIEFARDEVHAARDMSRARMRVQTIAKETTIAQDQGGDVKDNTLSISKQTIKGGK